jgi:hypothetical protein
MAMGQWPKQSELEDSPVIYDSVRVQVDGVLWNQVDYFTDSQPTKRIPNGV